MRRLLPLPEGTGPDLDDEGLRAAYAYPVDRPWVRANMVASLDGSAVREGRSGGLSGPADKRVFGVLRGLTDVVLVGAGTARSEGYRAPRAKPAYADLRAQTGQQPAPTLALVSRRLDLDPASALFTGDARTVVVTTSASEKAARNRLADVADLLVAGDDAVDIGAALDQLASRGLGRVLCEGGPSLLADVTAAGRLDELCLSLSPQLVGGSGPRILHGGGVQAAYAPAHVLEADGVLFARYVRA